MISEVVGNHWGNILYRGARPDGPDNYPRRTGRPLTVISLQQGWFELMHAESYMEDIWSGQLKFTLHHFPLSSIWRPTFEQVKACLRLIDAGLKTGDVFVHCKQGVDRTGYMIAAYRICKQGWQPHYAINEMFDFGFHHYRYYLWPHGLVKLDRAWVE